MFSEEKREKERVMPEFGEGKEEKFYPQIQGVTPRKEKLWKMSDDKAEGARNEVKRLLSARVIREVTYLEWLANIVMVKKANGKWRMCIDFMDLNKECSRMSSHCQE
jgi:hypothetical protein